MAGFNERHQVLEIFEIEDHDGLYAHRLKLARKPISNSIPQGGCL